MLLCRHGELIQEARIRERRGPGYGYRTIGFLAIGATGQGLPCCICKKQDWFLRRHARRARAHCEEGTQVTSQLAVVLTPLGVVRDGISLDLGSSLADIECQPDGDQGLDCGEDEEDGDGEEDYTGETSKALACNVGEVSGNSDAPFTDINDSGREVLTVRRPIAAAGFTAEHVLRPAGRSASIHKELPAAEQKLLIQEVKLCTSWVQVCHVIEKFMDGRQEGPAINDTCLGTILKRVAVVTRRTQLSSRERQELHQFLDQLLGPLQTFVDDFRSLPVAVSLTNTVWALARLAHDQQYLLDQAVCEYLLRSSARCMPFMRDTQLCRLGWSLATMSVLPPPQWREQYEGVTFRIVELQGKHVGPQGLSQLIWSLAQWGHGPHPHWLDAYLACCASQMRAFAPQDLAVVGWSLVHLGVPPPHADWSRRWLEEWEGKALLANTHDLSMALWVSCRWNLRPHETWLDVTLERLQSHMRLADHAHLGRVIWSLARLNHRPRRDWMARFMMETLIRLPQFSPLGLSTTLWSLVRLRVKPPVRWMDSYLAAAYELLPLFQPQEHSAMLWALSRLRCIPDEEWMDLWWEATGEMLAEFGPQDLPVCFNSVISLGQAPPRSWLIHFMRVSVDRMQDMTPGGLAMILCAFAGLEQRPGTRWLEEFFTYTGSQAVMATFDVLSLERSIWALAVLKVAPEASWLCAYYCAVEQKLEKYTDDNLCNTLVALARLRCMVPDTCWDEIMRVVRMRLRTMEDSNSFRVLWAISEMRPQDGEELKQWVG